MISPMDGQIDIHISGLEGINILLIIQSCVPYTDYYHFMIMKPSKSLPINLHNIYKSSKITIIS